MTNSRCCSGRLPSDSRDCDRRHSGRPKVHVAYIPQGKVIGLSKVPRLMDVFARRLQVQGRLTTQIAEAIESAIKPQGVG